MTIAPEIENELKETAVAFLAVVRMTGDIHSQPAAELDKALERVSVALKDAAEIPKSIVSELAFILSRLLRLADTANDPGALRAEALRFADRISAMFPVSFETNAA